MNNRKVFQWAWGLSQVLTTVLVFSFALFIGSLTYSFLRPTAFQSVIIDEAFQAGYGINNIKICKLCDPSQHLFLSELNSPMKIWLLLRGSVFFILTLLMLRSFKKILLSIKASLPFYHENIKAFQKLAQYGFLASFFSAFNFIYLAGDSDWHFTIPFGALAFSIACLILADIFKTGQALVEDKNSIV